MPPAARRGSTRRRAVGDSGRRASGSPGRPRGRPAIAAATTAGTRAGDDQPVHRLEAPARATSSAASQSSSSRWLGSSPIRPKSLDVPTRPRPKCPCQSRLTITRAVIGWSGRVSHSASARRRPLEPAEGAIAGPDDPQSPARPGTRARRPAPERRARRGGGNTSAGRHVRLSSIPRLVGSERGAAFVDAVELGEQVLPA